MNIMVAYCRLLVLVRVDRKTFLLDKFNEVPCQCLEVVKRLELCLVDRFYKKQSGWD